MTITIVNDTNEATERLLAQVKATEDGTLPAGKHAATLTKVVVIKRKKDDVWRLGIFARVDANDRYVMQWRPLAKTGDDPFALSKDQLRRWRVWARTMGLPANELSVEEQVRTLSQMVNVPVTATVRHTPVGVQTSLERDTGEVFASNGAALTTEGELTSRDRPSEAHEAHAMLVRGLGAARLALSAAAQACHRLSREQAWVDLGFATLKEYLASPEISISRTEFFDLANIWERYIIEGGAEPTRLQVGGTSKLAVPLPALERGDVTVEEALDDVEAMGLRDLREKYRGDSDPKPADDPPATDVCPHCGLAADVNGDALVYADRTWPAWVTDDMARAAVKAADSNGGWHD